MDFLAIEEIRWHTKTAQVVRKWHRFRGINDFQPIASRNHTVLLPSCERCHIVTFLESRVLRQHHFAHTISVNWLHITIHSTQRKSYDARASQQAWTPCLCLCLSLFLDFFFVYFSCRMRNMRILARKAEAEMVIREEGEENRHLNLPYQGWREECKRYSLPSCVGACMGLQTDKGFSQAHHWYHPLGAPSAVGWYESPNLSPSPSPPHNSWKSPACCSPLGPQMSSFSRSRRRRRRRRSSPAQRGKFLLPPKKISNSNLRENPALLETGTVTLELGPVLNVLSSGRFLQLYYNTEEGHTSQELKRVSTETAS